MSTETKPRESRMWWAVDKGRVQSVTGYSCKPNSPLTWWVPELGWSGNEGNHLFQTEREALAKVISELKQGIERKQSQLNQLLDRISKCPP